MHSLIVFSYFIYFFMFTAYFSHKRKTVFSSVCDILRIRVSLLSFSGKRPRVARLSYTLLGSVFPPLLHPLFLHVSFKHSSPQLSHSCSLFMDGRAPCQPLSHVWAFEWRLQTHIYCILMGKKEAFSKIWKLPQRLAVFINPWKSTIQAKSWD